MSIKYEEEGPWKEKDRYSLLMFANSELNEIHNLKVPFKQWKIECASQKETEIKRILDQQGSCLVEKYLISPSWKAFVVKAKANISYPHGAK